MASKKETPHRCSVVRCDEPFPAPYKVYLDGNIWDWLCKRHAEFAQEFLEGEQK